MTSAQRGPHARADGDALAAARNPAEAKPTPLDACRQTAVFWPRNRVLAQHRRDTLQNESNDLGFSELPDLIIPKTAGNRLRTCQNAVSWPKSNDLAARTAAFRGADGRARSSSIRRGPRPERTTRGLIRKHAPLLQADAPRASSGATTCRSARSPPANTKGSARSISTAETAPLRQNPLPRSAPIANPVRRQPARSNLRRVCDGSTGKACRNRIGFALESRWNRSGAA